jgi:uncharacterized protein (UPF0218 family)
VGDVTSLTLIEEGFRPKLILVDFKSERREMDPGDPRRARLASYGDHCVRVMSPPAVISDELWDAVERALKGEGTWRVEVTGEEDLAVLPCMAMAAEGARIVYGMPGEGMVVVDNTVAMITWARAFLARMEVG